MNEGGKGCKPRPFNIPMNEFDKKFDSVFGKKISKYCANCGKLPSWCECKEKK